MRAHEGNQQEGFSLPELLVVLAILMLLAVLAVPRYQGVLEKAEEAKAKQTMHAIHTSQEAQRISRGSYSSSFDVLSSETGDPLASEEAETGGGTSAAESVMVFRGYIYRLNRATPTEYTVTAEPIRHRDSRPHYRMNQRGHITTLIGGQVVGEEGVGAGVAPPGEEEQPPGNP
ncbi:MAG: type IV pilin protein [Terriglobia bacterium]